ncbi:unnamed protein product [Gemmataceae bacterium]|nr:unnamed protein product [Gemmataceae bacterium]VTT99069.1 unnamed protein product [Gemmataceae bacterium]
MSIKNVWAGDVALIELTRSGRTDAPGEILAELKHRGHLTLDKSGTPSLTGAGVKRAEALKPCEANLRAMAVNASTGRAPLMTASGSGLRG